MEDKTGLVHLYCGSGKGKTTAALGLALRAAGRGKQVVIARFLKTEDSGELFSLAHVPNIRILPCQKSFGFTFLMDVKTRREASRYYTALFEQAVREVMPKEKGVPGADLLVLDEILGACNAGLTGKDKLEEFLQNRPSGLETVLTGRGPWEELIKLSDYITRMEEVKHPYQSGVKAREGIEY